jgi:hypothetical protein
LLAIAAFGGGTRNGSTFSTRVDIYNSVSAENFTVILSRPRLSLSATASANRIFFDGGKSGDVPSNVVHMMSSSKNTLVAKVGSAHFP